MKVWLAVKIGAVNGNFVDQIRKNCLESVNVICDVSSGDLYIIGCINAGLSRLTQSGKLFREHNDACATNLCFGGSVCISYKFCVGKKKYSTMSTWFQDNASS